MLPESIVREIRQQSAASPDAEVCGFVVWDRTFGYAIVPQINIHQEPKENFAISANEYAAISELTEIIGIYHSHVNENDNFSIADVKASKALQIPYILCHAPTLAMWIFDPTTIAPYVGRQWNWVTSNCFTLLQDYYKQELGFEIPDFYLSRDRAWEHEDVGYLENFPNCGFRELVEGEQIETHDVILMSDGKFHNHVGIISDANINKMLHHFADHLSNATVYGSHWQKATHSIWRLV